MEAQEETGSYISMHAGWGKWGRDQLLWHRRLGHLNYGDMERLKRMSTGMQYTRQGEVGMCVSCCRGKMAERAFPGHNERGKHALQVVYADVWGPVEESLQGHRYALVLVDDFTSYVWVYFMSTKSQTEDILKLFIRQQENAGKHILKLRTDNGGIYFSVFG